MLTITNKGQNCTLSLQERDQQEWAMPCLVCGVLREVSGHRRAGHERSLALLNPDVMGHSFAIYSAGSSQKDAAMQAELETGVAAWLARPPLWLLKDQLGNCMAPAYQAIEGPNFLWGYHLLKG